MVCGGALLSVGGAIDRKMTRDEYTHTQQLNSGDVYNRWFNYLPVVFVRSPGHLHEKRITATLRKPILCGRFCAGCKGSLQPNRQKHGDDVLQMTVSPSY